MDSLHQVVELFLNPAQKSTLVQELGLLRVDHRLFPSYFDSLSLGRTDRLKVSIAEAFSTYADAEKMTSAIHTSIG